MGRRDGSGGPTEAEAELVDLTGLSDGDRQQRKRRGPSRGAGARRGSAAASAAAGAAVEPAAPAATAEPAGARPGRSPVQAAAAAAAAARAGQPVGDLAAPAAAAAAAAAAGAGAPKRRRSSGDGGGGGRGTGPHKKAAAGKERREDAYGNTVSWRPKASGAVLARIERASGGHRLMLLARKPLRPVGAEEGGGAEEFAVYGATGNAYTVTICRQPSCTCPDAGKGNICKHILFVMLRVLHMSPDEPLVWQKALLSSEVDEILSGRKSLPRTLGGGQVLAPEAVREQYRRRASLGGAAEGEGEEGGAAPLRRSAEGADCPVCYEPLEVASEKISFCAACGNNCHSSCIGEWVKKRRREGAQPTCPLCRAAWVDGAAPAGAAGAVGAGGEYINLADAAGAPVPTLEELYGDRALWIHAHQGDIPRGVAANIWRGMGH